MYSASVRASGARGAARRRHGLVRPEHAARWSQRGIQTRSSSTTPAPNSIRTPRPTSSGRVDPNSMNAAAGITPTRGAGVNASPRRSLRQFASDPVLTRSRSHNAAWLKPLRSYASTISRRCCPVRCLRLTATTGALDAFPFLIPRLLSLHKSHAPYRPVTRQRRTSRFGRLRRLQPVSAAQRSLRAAEDRWRSSAAHWNSSTTYLGIASVNMMPSGVTPVCRNVHSVLISYA
jgi:hypothetical protein